MLPHLDIMPLGVPPFPLPLLSKWNLEKSGGGSKKSGDATWKKGCKGKGGMQSGIICGRGSTQMKSGRIIARGMHFTSTKWYSSNSKICHLV